MGRIAFFVILSFMVVIGSWFRPAVKSYAGGPLPVVYNEEDEDKDDSDFSNNHIDNQAYLEEYEKSRRLRTSAGSLSSFSVVIEKKRNRSFPHRNWNYPQKYRNNSYSIEFQNGTGSLRYYDGYRPNCCGSWHSIGPLPLRSNTQRP